MRDVENNVWRRQVICLSPHSQLLLEVIMRILPYVDILLRRIELLKTEDGLGLHTYASYYLFQCLVMFLVHILFTPSSVEGHHRSFHGLTIVHVGAIK